jgi:hypothetical protein
MPKPMLIGLVWGIALLISGGLRWWGELRSIPLQAPSALVLLVVFLPSILLGVWIVLATASGVDDGTRESKTFD